MLSVGLGIVAIVLYSMVFRIMETYGMPWWLQLTAVFLTLTSGLLYYLGLVLWK